MAQLNATTIPYDIVSCVKSQLAAYPVTNGNIYYVFDTKEIAVDMNGSRTFFSGYDVLADEQAKDNLLAPLTGRLYVVKEGGKLYLRDGENWVNIGGVGLAVGNRSEIFNTYEGENANQATGECAHAEGQNTKAKGNYSHAEGTSTNAQGESSHAEGTYNVGYDDAIHEVGIGSSAQRKNAHTITIDGKHYIPNIGGYDGITLTGAKDLATVLSEVDDDTPTVHAYEQYTKRATAGETSVKNATARMIYLAGTTAKQVCKDWQFKNYLVDWILYRNDVSVTSNHNGRSLSVNSPSVNYGFVTYFNAVPNHKYFTMARVLTSASDVWARIDHNWPGSSNLIDRKFATAKKWSITTSLSQILNLGNNGAMAYVHGSNYQIDAEFGFQVFDLTEMGLDSILTTCAQCEEYFGLCHVPYGVHPFAPQKHISTGFNQYDKSTMLVRGKEINATTGAISSSSTYDLLVVPCIKSEIGTGKNNGYRINRIGGEGYLRVGWNPFPYGHELFDKAYDIASISSGSTYKDYSSNKEGYLYIQIHKGYSESAVVHFKWSYNEAQFAAIYGTAQAEYKKDEFSLTEIGELNGLRNASGILCCDDVDFKAGKKHIRVRKRILTGSENWTKRANSSEGSYSIFIFNGFFANSASDFPILVSGEYGRCAGGSWSIVGSNPNYASKVGTGLCFSDKDFGLSTSVDVWKSRLAEMYSHGEPLTVWYLDGNIDDTDCNVFTSYDCSDFGTEEMVSAVPMSRSQTEYFDSHRDFVKSMQARAVREGGFATMDAVKNLYEPNVFYSGGYKFTVRFEKALSAEDSEGHRNTRKLIKIQSEYFLDHPNTKAIVFVRKNRLKHDMDRNGNDYIRRQKWGMVADTHNKRFVTYYQPYIVGDTLVLGTDASIWITLMRKSGHQDRDKFNYSVVVGGRSLSMRDRDSYRVPLTIAFFNSGMPVLYRNKILTDTEIFNQSNLSLDAISLRVRSMKEGNGKLGSAQVVLTKK